MFAILWTAFTLFLATVIWKTSREHGRPQLGFSSYDNRREQFFARFFRKMSITAVGLCLLSALLVWSTHFWAFMCLLAIPAVAALQISSTKKSLGSGNRSLP